jgi:murein DD-endopeptidase MepM/ murein hydrolase activator NlpD
MPPMPAPTPTATPDRRSRAVAALVAAALTIGGIGAGLGWPGPAWADEHPAEEQPFEGDPRGDLQEEVIELTEEELRLIALLDKAEQELKALAAAVRSLDAQIAETELRLQEAQDRHDELLRHEQQVQRRLERAVVRLAEAEDLIVKQAVEAYVTGNMSTTALNLILSAGSPRDLHLSRTLVDAMLEDQRRTIDRVRTLRIEVEGLHAEARGAREEAAEVRNAVVMDRAELVHRRDAANGVRAQTARAASAHATLLGEVENRREMFQAEIAAAERTASALVAELSQRQAHQIPISANRGTLAVPVPMTNMRVSSTFGLRVHPVYGGARLHSGIDFAAPHGTPIYAAGDGVVVWAGPRGGYGNTVVVDHGGAVATLSAHMSRMAVIEGDVVTRGQIIGFVGSTGTSTGPHLHFEVRLAGTPVDPLGWL